MRTIQVIGSGSAKVRPDLTVMDVTLEGTEETYAAALKRSTVDTEKLKDIFESFGFARTELKTRLFHVYEKFETVDDDDLDDDDDEPKERSVGFTFDHEMKIEFDSDNALLSKIIFTLAKSDIRPRFNIRHTVKNREAVKKDLTGKAVADAKDKAETLAAAAGVKLVRIQSIDYTRGDYRMEVNPLRELCNLRKIADFDDDLFGGYTLDIEPEDIDISDSVTVIWEIE